MTIMKGSLPELVILFGSLHLVATIMCLVLPSKLDHRQYVYFLFQIWKRYVFNFGAPYLLDHFSVFKPLFLVRLIQLYMSFSLFYVVNSTTGSVANFDYVPGTPLEFSNPLIFLFAFAYFLYVMYSVGFLIRECEGGMATHGPYPSTRSLVTSGPFSYLRSPIASAGILFHLVSLVFEPSIRVAIYLALEFAILTAWFKYYEEPALRERFGQSYEAYFVNVPRWIPNLSSYSPYASVENPNEGV